ncbi:potassium/proton antiporter [Mangrovibacillus cuniculi]|uniref:Potassium/proton antiporter n=1 Tax=Mangrovibacillus cuniculi TaxID=2593652 RepID=A0A7S8CD41_9BACI|nr:potassium/proton antiporter [Mangrovibacillus cuniculi]QPC47789.1 potassium/proton antiporter [Mangrovibacillus cuniculi]
MLGDSMIFLAGLILLIGVLTTKFSNKIGVPSLILFLAVGMFLSQFYYFDNAQISQVVGIFALIVILFEGGLQTKWREVKPVIAPSLSLATIGVLLTASIVGIAAKFILDLSWLEGLLIGAIVGSTDAAAVFAAIGSKNIRPRLASTLEAESGTNDPMAVFLTISLIELIQFPELSAWALLWDFVLQMGLGTLFGLLTGVGAVWALNKINLDSSGLYPIFALGCAVFTYGVTALLGGSGLLAVYLMAVFIGNRDIAYRHSIFRFNEGFAWMMQIVMFIILGLLVFVDELIYIAWQGILLSIILMLVARPVGVFISMIRSKFSLKEKTFIAWSGLKGAVPIVLATYPLLAGVENSALIFNVVFFVVLTSALIQGATISKLADKLGLAGADKVVPPHSMELVSMGKTNTDMMEIQVKKDSPVISKNLQSIILPEETLITAIIRGDCVVTPRGNTVIEEDDILYVLVPKKLRERTKILLQGNEE